MKRFLPLLFLLTVFTSGIRTDALLPQHFELNQLLVVNAVGIDIDEAGDFKVTLAYTQETEAGGVSLLNATGRSFSAAIFHASSYAGRSVFLGHTRLVILGREAAKRGLTEITDYVTRSYETSLSANVMTAEGQAADLLGASPFGSSDLLSELDTLLESLKVNSLSSPVTLAELAADAFCKTRFSVTPLVRTVQNETGSLNVMVGSAVYRDGKLFTAFTDDGALMLTVLRNKAQSHIFDVNTASAGRLSLRITSFQTKTNFREENGKIHAAISLDLRAAVIESSSGNLDDAATKEVVEHVQTGIKEQAVAFLSALGENDLCSFGDILRRFYPRLYRRWDQTDAFSYEVETSCLLENSFIHGGG